MTAPNEDNPTAAVAAVIEGLRIIEALEDTAVVLIGSVARGTATTQSDLDLLILSHRPVELKRLPAHLHIQRFTVEDFRSKLRAGDDFVAWCVRYGVPVVLQNWWTDIVASSEAETWPNWRAKVHHAFRRLCIADALLQANDIAAAHEEMSYSVSHVARAVLLSRGIFPLSRPEMIDQLGEVGLVHLSSLMNAFVHQQPDASTVRRARRYVKKLLVSLDREQYSELAAARRQMRAAKRKRRNQINRARSRSPGNESRTVPS